MVAAYSFNERSDREFWYRFEDVAYAGSVDEFGDTIFSSIGRMNVLLRKWPVFKHTPKGVWLGWNYRERFVLRDAWKRFACPTIPEAKESFRYRKDRQIRIHRARLRDAEEARKLIDDQNKFPDPVYKPTSLWLEFEDGDPITVTLGTDSDQKNYWLLAYQIESSRAAIDNRKPRRIDKLEVVQT